MLSKREGPSWKGTKIIYKDLAHTKNSGKVTYNNNCNNGDNVDEYSISSHLFHIAFSLLPLMILCTCVHPHILHGIVVVFILILSSSLETGIVTDPPLDPLSHLKMDPGI